MTDPMTTPSPVDVSGLIALPAVARLRELKGPPSDADLRWAIEATLAAHNTEADALREALAFYANEENWRSSTSYMCGHGAINCNVMADKGGKARAALKQEPKDA